MSQYHQFVLFLLFAFPITVIDMRECRIPDFLSLGGVAVFAALKLLTGEQSPVQVLAECLVGFGVFWLIWRFTGGQLGLGDAKYSMLIAVAAGFSAWFAALLFASLAGLVVAGIMIRGLKLDRRTRIPFAPFLTMGTVLAIHCGDVLGVRIFI
jgi:prepilin signal peptidase PulO-like enzyme (type II secretory pathway)